MSTIVLRATKGSPLTNAEVDANFSNLNTDKLESTYNGAMNSMLGGTSIATVGTVTAGTWSATTIATTKGGTGLTSYTTGDLLYSSASNTLSKLAKPAGTSILQMGSDGVPSWVALSATNITALGTVTVGTWNGSTIGAAYGGTGVANNAANTITFTGNYSLGLTLSANTAVTLPTSGTLATIAGTETLSNKTLTAPVIGVATGTSLALSSLTAGRIPYVGANGLISDASGLLFDSTNKTIVVGQGNSLGGTTNPIAAFTTGANNYVQTYIFNGTNGANSSADMVAYPDNGLDSSGWIDMGITSSAFSQAAYSVTGANEGYIFMSAPAGAGKTGNLVIATDSTGTANAIQFYTGGFNGTKSAPKLVLTSTGALAFGSNTAYGSTGQILQSTGNAAPQWVTAPYATTGKAIAMAMVFGG